MNTLRNLVPEPARGVNMPPILPMFFLEGVCFEALAFPFMLSISEKTDPAELTVAPPGPDTMRGVKGGVNLDHFGGAKVDQLVKG